MLLGERPRALLPFLAPTGLAVVLDLILRARSLAGWAVRGKAIYASSLLVSAALWVFPLWLAARLFARRARAPMTLLFVLWFVPLASLAFGGQGLYFRVFHAYMGRDTLRLGVALRGTVADWLFAWNGAWVSLAMLAGGVVVTALAAWLARRAAPAVGGSVPWLALLAFPGALVCCWVDGVDSRFLQAATPDACFLHGVVHAVRIAVTGRGELHQGMSLRTPAPLPPIASTRARKLDILLVVGESLRADAFCSDPPPACRARFLDEVAADRVALGRLTSPSPNTFSACMLLWTGLVPNVDFATAHSAPVLWELARVAGYRTAYVTSQNPNYEDFGAFTRRAGIDELVTGTDLGGMADEQLGAPDERATAEMLRFLRALPAGDPYFAVLHLSNTHAPYRTDPALEPFAPHSPDALGDVARAHNHYRNAALLEERTVASFVAGVRALPSWDSTVLVMIADHGEQFREHGGLYHNHSLYEEELRVPGWLVAGGSALTRDERDALGSWSGRRTYLEDVHETIVDLLGLEASRAALPFAEKVTGRSLVAPATREEPAMLAATSTAVWEPDDARYGVLQGDRAYIGPAASPWGCFDTSRDPGERSDLGARGCADLAAVARAKWGPFAPP